MKRLTIDDLPGPMLLDIHGGPHGSWGEGLSNVDCTRDAGYHLAALGAS